jgi:hypothetical protein
MIFNVQMKQQYNDLDLAEYTIPFPYWEESDIKVYLTTAIGDTLLIQGQDYEISHPGETGHITRLTSWNGLRITIARELLPIQNIDLQQGQKMDPDLIERMNDRQTALIQQILNDIARTARFPVTDVVESNVLPGSEERSGKLLAFDGSGKPVAVSNMDTTTIPITPWAATFLLSGSPGQAKALLQITVTPANVQEAQQGAGQTPPGNENRFVLQDNAILGKMKNPRDGTINSIWIGTQAQWDTMLHDNLIGFIVEDIL